MLQSYMTVAGSNYGVAYTKGCIFIDRFACFDVIMYQQPAFTWDVRGQSGQR